ncbi:MAG: large repetitive protein, partial [Verrucomicrobiota bacterium]
MISLHHHFAALVLLGGLLPAVADQSLDALKPQPTLRRGATRAFPASRQAAQQLLATVDAGDVYASAYGPKKLLRLADAIAVSADGDAGEFHRQLAAPGKALEGFVTTGTRAQGIAVLKSPREERQKYLIDPSTLRQLLQSVRSTTSGRSANPVFIDPSTGLRLLATSEIIIRLKPGIDGPNYFGADWARVKPLWGTTDQFVQTLPGATAEEILEAVSRHAAGAGVEWAEPNFIMQVAKSFTPDDALFIDQWHLQNAGQFGGKTGADAGLTGAWDITLGRSNVVVAILDDGVQLNHPDLAANIFINAGEIPGNGLDDDGNGFVDDVHGWDFFANDNDPNPANSLDNHGTSLAGVIAAVGNNGIGVSGVAPGCRILPLKMLTGEDGIPVSEVSRVLHYAAGLNLQGRSVWRGADIINISLTFAKSAVVDAALTAAATKGRNGKGCAIFCAAGNSAGAWVPFEVDFPVAGTYTLRWAFSKDPNDIFEVGADTVWIDNVIFPDGTVESFEQGGLPPGWITGGASPWINVVDGVGGNHALTGWNGPGSHSLRAGHLADSQTNYVEVTADIDAGTLRFWAWTESEAGNVAGEFQGFDIFQFIVDGNEIDYDFGVPVLETAVAYPASHPSTFGVGASTDFDFRADYSQFGATLDFVAPSDGGNANITTTDRTGADGYNGGASPDGDYAYDFGGTSAATPIASGIAALVLSTNPYLTLAELRTLLRSTCDHIGDVFYDDTGFNAFYGYGRLNAETAVKRARPNIIVSITAAPSPVVVGDSLTYSISVRNSGPSISGPVSITNELPAGVVTGAITPAPSQRIGRQLIFHATNMPSGSLLSYRIVVTNLTVGTNVDIVSVGTDIPESTVADNSATHVVTVL